MKRNPQAKLVKGDRLTDAQRRQVLAAFMYRLTFENQREHPAQVKQAGGKVTMSDDQWIREHAFRFTKSGRLSGRYAEPHYMAENPAGIRAQVRRLPSGQIQLKIPLKGSRRGNPVYLEDIEGKPLTSRLAKLQRYGDHMLKGGQSVTEVAQRLRGVLGKVMDHATITVDDGKGHRAYNPQGRGKCNPPRGEVDHHAATELELYVDNDGDLYRRQYQPILKNLATKKAKGIYQHHLAVKLFMYLMESGAKKYAKEFASPSEWAAIFSVPTRMVVAEKFAKHFETEYDLAAYNHLLPKKYQPKTAANPGQTPVYAVVRVGQIADRGARFSSLKEARQYRRQSGAGLAVYRLNQRTGGFTRVKG